MKKLLILLFLVLPINIKAIDTSASSAILMDMDSGRILYEKNAYESRLVASISKIMTAIIAIESGKLNDKVTIGDEINSSYGSGIYIKQGEVLTLRDLVYGLMLRSGNDASYSISKYVAGSTDKFVLMMNKKAKKIGMKKTVFNNPNGLDEKDGNYSSAYDMAILTSYAMRNKDYQTIAKTKNYTLKTNMNTYKWKNKNKLLFQYKYTTGGKTGFTKKARRTLVTTASKNNINLVVVTLNDGNDWQDHKKLFEYGFNNYQKHQILKKGEIHISDNYYKNYKYYIKNNYYYLLTKEEKDKILIKYVINKKRKFSNNMKVGTINIYLGNILIHKENLYVRVKKRSFWSRIGDLFGK